MRNYFNVLCCASLFAVSVAANSARAVTITGGTGPGGFENAVSGPSTLLLWLKADAISGLNDNDNVMTWANSATHGTSADDAVQNTAALQPTFQSDGLSTVNGNPVVRFDGLASTATGDSMRVTSLGLGNNASIYLVSQDFSPQNNSGGSCCRPMLVANNIEAASTNGYNLSLVGSGDTDNLFYSDPGVQTFVDNALTLDGTYHLTTLTRDGNTAGGLRIRRDGTQISSRNPGNAVTGTVYDIGGQPNNAARHFAGGIGEVVAFNRTLNDAEQRIVENHLSAKYAIPLTSGNLYDGDTPANGDYDRDVFGIGSLTTGPNPGSVTSAGSAGLGIEAAGGTLGNTEFVLAGHKVETNSLVESGGFLHWDREWYVDKTDVNGIDATLAFDASDAGLSGTPAGFSLLYRPDELSSFSALALSGTLNGDTLSFLVPNALLVDGLYTIGFLVPEPSSFALLALGLCGLARRRRGRR